MHKFVLGVLLLFFLAACDLNRGSSETYVFLINSEIIEGKDVYTFELKNKNGTTIHLTNYGAIVKKMLVSDRYGNFENIVLGFDKVEQYKQNGYFFGATIGRYANRIANGRFTLDEKIYQLTQNNGPNHLHGGKYGFNEVIWNAEAFEQHNQVGVRMTYISPDGEEGYPGELTTIITFLLDDNDVFSMNYEASTDKKTIVNLTHHGYFNLSAMKNDVLDHELTIYGDYYTPIDAASIPTGEIKKVQNTPFDFTNPQIIGDRIGHVNGGYTLNYIISKDYNGNLKKHAEIYHSPSGRVMEVHSDAPGIQLYTGNFLDGVEGTDGIKYDKHYGLCLEPQFFPDSPNNPHFPSSNLSPNETYSRHIEFRFKTK